MPEMKAANLKDLKGPKYFRGDELPETSVKASFMPTDVVTSEIAGH
jgi:hypothetical protein